MDDIDSTQSAPSGDENLPWRRRFDPESLIGWEVAEKFKITRHLGSGGFGEVYEGYNMNLPEQHVVIKFLKQVHSRERFEKEAKILCLLDHPNICRIIEFMPEEQAVIMPFIQGKDCSQLLDDTGPLPEESVLSVARSITSAMAYAHRMNIAHRDIKPSNIMIDHHKHVYLIDFGIAKQMDATTFTKTGQQPLTPQFAAPERMTQGSGYNPILSDVFEIGSTIFKLATNCSPYEFSRWHDAGIETDPAVRRLSGPMKHIIRKATQRDPQDRYRSIDEMSRDFNELRSVYIRRRWSRKAASLVIVAVIAGAGFWFHEDMGELYSRVTAKAKTDTVLQESAAKNDDEQNQPGQTLSDDSQKTPVEEKQKDESGTAQPKETKPIRGEANTSGGSNKPSPTPSRTDVKESSSNTPSRKDESPSRAEAEIVSTEPEKPQSPPEPAQYRLHIHTIPLDAAVYLDSRDSKFSGPQTIDTGYHTIRAVHEGYPILTDTMRLTQDTSITMDLTSAFAARPEVPLLIGYAHDLGGKRLEIKFNGKAFRYSDADLPIYDRSVKAGPWIVECNFVDNTGSARGADSLVIFPYQDALRRTIMGNRGIIDFNNPSWLEQPSVQIEVYGGD